MTTIPNTIAPFCGWGDRHTDPASFIPFSIVRADSTGTLPDWSYGLNLVVEPIPGGNRVDVQNMGMGPASITLRLWFDDGDDYARLIGQQGTMNTLTVVRGTQRLAGTDEYVQGMAYTHLDHVLLVSLSNVTNYVSGEVECDAQFLRAVDPLTRRAAS